MTEKGEPILSLPSKLNDKEVGEAVSFMTQPMNPKHLNGVENKITARAVGRLPADAIRRLNRTIFRRPRTFVVRSFTRPDMGWMDGWMDGRGGKK